MKTTSQSWPFILEENGTKIKENMFYGFYDCGGVFNSSGYENQEDAVRNISRFYGESAKSDISTEPSDLGSVAICILSGRQFVTRLQMIQDEDISDYGRWS